VANRVLPETALWLRGAVIFTPGRASAIDAKAAASTIDAMIARARPLATTTTRARRAI
jgi:hypothetical protein